jgi:23S rRNA pseudouridine1911/1915/1917 synthase
MKKLPPKGGRRLRKQDRHQLRVLYEDDAVVVLNKPAKLLAVPADNSDIPSALSLLSAELKSRRQRAFVVHRIDRYTSGILLFAKTWPDREALVQQFLRHTPVRQYLAVVRGHLRLKEGTLVHYFRQEGMCQKVTTGSDPQAARAELR